MLEVKFGDDRYFSTRNWIMVRDSKVFRISYYFIIKSQLIWPEFYEKFESWIIVRSVHNYFEL